MGDLSIKINLRQFKSIISEVKGKNGNMVKCLILPIAENKFVEGEKGVYVDLVGFQLKEKIADRKDTHLVKQSLPKEEREKLSKEQLQSMPIIGNAIDWGKVNREPEPEKSGELQGSTEITIPVTAAEGSDDLPF